MSPNVSHWIRAALVRAARTAAQTAAAAIGTTAVLTGIDWTVVGSTAAVAAILSLLTSIGGLPEVSDSAPAPEPDDAATLTPDERAMIRDLRLMEGRDPLPGGQ